MYVIWNWTASVQQVAAKTNSSEHTQSFPVPHIVLTIVEFFRSLDLWTVVAFSATLDSLIVAELSASLESLTVAERSASLDF